MGPKRIIGLMAAVALMAWLAVGLALAGLTPPKAGRWKLDPSGGFTVSKDHRTVTAFHADGTACGLAKNVVVKGALRLHTITEGGVTNWIVGYADPKRTSKYDAHGLVGQKVLVRSGTTTVIGRIDIVFAVAGYARNNDGDLVVNGCDISFFTHHA